MLGFFYIDHNGVGRHSDEDKPPKETDYDEFDRQGLQELVESDEVPGWAKTIAKWMQKHVK